MNFLLSGLFCVFSTFAFANNQLLVLSGGNSPSGNHYSQYLQTNTIYSDMKERLNYPVSVFFAAGNNDNSKTPYADVHKTEKENGLTFDKYIYGVINGNRAATKSNVLNYFASEIPSNLENFFLIVSDHGMPHVNSLGEPDLSFTNNCIDLWNIKFENGQLREIGGFEEARCLSQQELSLLLRQNVKAKNHVFAMSQCFSGGFHQMAVSTLEGYPTITPGICGFTAVTEDTYASGCSPDVDGPSYQGYERSFTEQLTGLDYVNRKRLRPGKKSFKDAHEAALLEDLTVDIPLATSDYYLWKWSTLLSNNIAFEMGANYSAKVQSPDFENKLQITRKMEAVVKQQFPEFSDKVDLPIKKLEQYVSQLNTMGSQLETSAETLFAKYDQLFFDLFYGVWIDQLISGKSLDLTNDELSTERMIVHLENSGNGSGAGIMKRQILPLMWSQDPTAARLAAIYLTERQNKILDYVAATGNDDLKNKAAEMKDLEDRAEQIYENVDRLGKQHGLFRRLLIYRQILGSWVNLNSMAHVRALSDLQETLKCEQTSLF